MTTLEMIEAMSKGYECDCGMRGGKYCKSSEIFKKFGNIVREERDEARKLAEEYAGELNMLFLNAEYPTHGNHEVPWEEK